LRNRIQRVLTLPLTAALSVAADQVTKYFVRANLSPGQSVELTPWLGSIFQVTYVTNPGAAFGLFPNGSQVLIVVAVFVIVALVWYYIRLSDGQWLVQLALGLQLGGAIGNLIDRLRFGGSVVDFIDLNFWPLRRWPVFNIADASIVTGVSLLTVLMIWEGWQEEHADGQWAAVADD
jgi:signal peptidase II